MKSPTRRMIDKYIANNELDHGITGLAKESGFVRKTLYDKMEHPQKFTVFELRILDEVLHFTDEDLIKLVRGE